ncbi:Protein CBG26337 [Caenorhabditis briggsae]|uniref:Protein CBG26337 n=1 Tax=Caenorhabditis briggsae TaxID=6238 RepID=B6IGA9_CAEBR|nr:Protein CBG26337 [Caenorhabditis briggsae]CAR98939.1 Protein CBG26337 [Caenorhabditis briggsae]
MCVRFSLSFHSKTRKGDEMCLRGAISH